MTAKVPPQHSKPATHARRWDSNSCPILGDGFVLPTSALESDDPSRKVREKCRLISQIAASARAAEWPGWRTRS